MISLLIFFTLSSASADMNTCKPGEHWVRAFHRKSYFRSDGTHVSDADVVAHCQKNSLAYSFLAPKFKDGRPEGWPNPNEQSKPWTESEKERMIEALESLPEKLWNRKIGELYRMARSKDAGNFASSDRNRNIALYDDAFMDGRIPLARILAHELGHMEFLALSDSDKNAYLSTTNWYLTQRGSNPPLILRRECCFVADDGKTSPEEDFANNIEYFLFDRNTLREKTPWAERWMKERFGDTFRPRGKGVPKQ